MGVGWGLYVLRFGKSPVPCPDSLEPEWNDDLLLDKVSDMPLAQQAKLLRVIEDGAIIPVGASTPIRVDVRIVAATNVDLPRAIEDGQFRGDLLDRLEVLTLRLPTLHARPEDVPLLLDHLFAVANEAEGTQLRSPNSEVRGELVSACTGGSIRVLKNAVRLLVVVKRRGRVVLADLESAGLEGRAKAGRCFGTGDASVDPGRLRLDLEFERGTTYREVMAHVVRAVTDATLRANDGSASAAADELGMAKSTWYRVRGT